MPPCTVHPPSIRCIVALALIGLTPGAALGESLTVETPADQPADDPADEVTRYAFDDDLVRGDVPSPDAEVLHARRRNDRQSLIRVRSHFVPELLEAAEDL